MVETSESWSYAGFISYSHTGDAVFAERLQRGVEQFAKPWNRMRAVRLFRDDTNLTASPGLWDSITTALTSSQWFVVILSPEAAASHWVGREISHWLETRRSTDHMLIVVTAGDLVWDEAAARFDPARSTALPSALAQAFPEEPLWIDARWARTTDQYDDQDPRMQRAVVDVAAAIRGLSKDELVGTAAREHRRTTRIKRSAQGALATLLVLSIVATVIALGQRHTAVRQRQVAETQTGIARTQTLKAEDQTRVAQAGELAALSQSQLDSNLAAASTLAVSAYQKDANFQTHAALVRAAVASPHFVTSVDLGGTVSALPIAPTMSGVVAGLTTGAVVVWHNADASARPVLTLPAAVSSVAQDAAADVVVASDGSHVILTAPGVSPTEIGLPRGMQVSSVSVTPDGTFAWVHGTFHGNTARSTFVEIDISGRSTSVRSSHLPAEPAPLEFMATPDDDTLVLFNRYPGSWYRLDVHDGHVEVSGTDYFGIHEAIFGSSPDMAYLANSNDDTGSLIQVWRSTSPRDPQGSPAEAGVPVLNPRSIAVTPDGALTAVADNGIVYVDGTTLSSVPSNLVPLTGARGSDDDGVRFLDDHRLISVYRGALTLWDLDQAGRLGATTRLDLEPACGGCPGAGVAVGTGGRMLITDGTPVGGRLIQPSGSVSLPTSTFDFAYDQPLWDPQEDRFVLPISAAPGGRTIPEPLPQVAGIRIWSLGQVPGPSADATALASVVTKGDTVVSALSDGKIYVQEADDGTVIDSFAGEPSPPTAASVSSDGKTVALAEQQRIDVVDVATHRVVRTIRGQEYDFLALTDDALFASTTEGALTEWSTASGSLVREFSNDPSYGRAFTLSPLGTEIARVRDDSQVDLVDTATGQLIGSLPGAGSGIEFKVVAAFAPEGDRVVTVGETTRNVLLNVHDLSTTHLVSSVCARVVPNLTEEAWSQFAGDAPYSPPDC